MNSFARVRRAFQPLFTWRTTELADGVRVDLGGQITIDEAPALWKRASELIDELGDKQRVQIDNSAVEVIDGACMALLVHQSS
jgi:ABC-type transporter Mla MlaB component